VRRFLGAPPPANLISVALIVYAFSALTLILARIAQGSGIYKGWSHLFYITAFYIFFGFAQTLRQVVDFYDRGGNAPDGNTDGNIRNLGLTEGQKHDLVNFLIALTDERVRFEQAPFDHPSLIVAKGEFVPAVGAAGRAEPITPFGNVNQHRQ